MPKIILTLPHKFPKEEAVEKSKQLLEKLKTEHLNKISDASQEWNGNSGNLKFDIIDPEVVKKIGKQHIRCFVRVKDEKIEIEAEVSYTIFLKKQEVEKFIKEQAEKLLV